jgi:hypothetical protein
MIHITLNKKICTLACSTRHRSPRALPDWRQPRKSEGAKMFPPSDFFRETRARRRKFNIEERDCTDAPYSWKLTRQLISSQQSVEHRIDVYRVIKTDNAWSTFDSNLRIAEQ